MKTISQIFSRAVLLLMAAITVASCNKEGTLLDGAGILVTDEAALAQTAYADETGVSRSVNFVTAAAWTSAVVETAATAATTAASGITAAVPATAADGTGAWLSITPDHGDAAGSYTITVTLAPNYTGQTRSATIEISSNGQKVNIAVTQQGTTENGSVPVDPNGSIDPAENTITFDRQVYPVVKTEFFAAAQWVSDDASASVWMHRMRFYASDNFYVELSLVTGSQTFSGGAFTFGDIQMNNMNKAAGSVNLPGADGLLTQESIEWGTSLRALRASDNTLTVDFNRVTTGNTKKEVSLHFSGAFENTDYGDGEFVPVRNIAFPDEHALSTLKAKLNTVYQLSDAEVQPNTATSRGVKWAAEGAALNGLSLTFNRAGTATVTATIREGMMGADGNRADYVQTWEVVVGEDGTTPDLNATLTYDGEVYEVVKTEYSVGTQTMQDGNIYKSHQMKFYIDDRQYLWLSLITGTDEFTGGDFDMVLREAAALNTVLGEVNFTTATGAAERLARCNTRVRVERRPDNTLLIDFQGAFTEHDNKTVSLHFEGAYENTDNGDPNPEPAPEQLITFNGTQHPIVKAEHTVANYTSRDGSFTAKCHKFRFYINSSRYAEVTIVNNNDELTSDQYVFGDYSILNAVGTAEAFFNFTTDTGAADYAQKGGKVRVVRGDANGSNGNTRVEFMYNDVTTQAGNLPIKLLYVGKLTETGNGDPGYNPDPEEPALGQLYVNQTSFNLTECVVSFNYQTQLMSITFTGNNCSLALETYVHHTDEAMAPTLDGTFTVRYLTADRPYWDERFDNVFTKAYVSATGPESTWGNWHSGVREGTQITVKLNSRKINLSMQQALVNGVDDRTVSLEYDNTYERQ